MSTEAVASPKQKSHVFLKESACWVRYLYFMRFSLLLWIFPVLLIGANHFLAKPLISGLLVPEYFQGYLCVAFFIVSAGFVALIAGRAVVINGPVRFGSGGKDEERPQLLKTLLVNDKAEWEWMAPLGSQIWSVCVFWYLYSYGVTQGVDPAQILLGLFSGSALAVSLWYVANAWYYLTYDAPAAYGALTQIQLGKNAARTILFPRRWFFLNVPGKSSNRSTIETAVTNVKGSKLDKLLRATARFLSNLSDLAGYLDPNGQLYEAHQFSLFAVIIFVGLYFTIWPLTAPVLAVAPSVAALIISALGVIVFDRVFWSAQKGGVRLLWWKLVLTFEVTSLWILFVLLYVFCSAERFPILALILIMAMALCWGLAGIAFFLDRYRLPVLSAVILLMILPRLPMPPVLPWTGEREEHYFSTVRARTQPPAPAPTPAEVLDERWSDPSDNRPLIIVTATGGGLHASAWTTAVLAQLEREFNQTDALGPAEPFHKHLLLLSTVSGGSVGLLSYLREIQDQSPDFTRMQISGQCSSLEAVGWGLVYYDLQKTFLPLSPYLMPISSGDGDLDDSPLMKDRTWSLRKAFARNLNNKYCEDTWKRDTKQTVRFADRFRFADKRDAQARNEGLESRLTLRSMLPGQLPAFTMNTTTVEEGSRFLLANYRVPHYSLDQSQTYPAQSFLDSFGVNDAVKPDLPLTTAAQLSATFPFVSSATRVAESVDSHSVHFVDGGYYDNDGTASAIEFLRFALAPSEKARETEPEDANHRASIQSKLNSHHKLRILWLEIRNSGDFDGGKNQTSGGNNGSPGGWNLFNQVEAPLNGFWNAGNVGVTGRNRVALGLLDLAYEKQMHIHRIILTDTNSQVLAGTDPLNWSLTPRQRKEVRDSADPVTGIGPNYREAKCWFSNWDHMMDNAIHKVQPPPGFQQCWVEPQPSASPNPRKP